MATPALRSYWERVEYSLTYLSFASFNAPYNLVHFMYEKRIASIQFLILHLMVPKISAGELEPRALEPSIFSGGGAGAGAFLNISSGAGATKYLSAPVLSIANFNNFLS